MHFLLALSLLGSFLPHKHTEEGGVFRFVHCTLSLVVVTKYLVRICESHGDLFGLQI